MTIPLKDMPAVLHIQDVALDVLLCSIGKLYGYTRFIGDLNYNRCLADGVSQASSCQLDLLDLLIYTQIGKDRGGGEQFLRVEQPAVEDQPAIRHCPAQLGLAGQDGLLDHAGHARLLSAPPFGRVGIRIGRERAVIPRAFIESQASPDIPVVFDERPALRIILKSAGSLLRGQQQLGDHVPVDAAQAFVRKERPRATGEFIVMEGLLEQRADLFGL